MGDKKYIVLDVKWTEGIERLRDSPVGRHIYRAGEVIELDPLKESVAEFLASGVIAKYVEAPVEDPPPKKKSGGE